MRRKKELMLSTGTKAIKRSPKDPFFAALEQRIEREPSVQIWSYKVEKNVAIIKINFNDGEPYLDLRVNPYDLSALQKAVQTLDAYFASKLGRC